MLFQEYQHGEVLLLKKKFFIIMSIPRFRGTGSTVRSRAEWIKWLFARLKFVQLVVEFKTGKKQQQQLILTEIRHVFPFDPSEQVWRQIESKLMEHLWGQSSRVGSMMGSKNEGMWFFFFWSGGLGVGICAPWSCVSGLEQTCSRAYVDKTVHDFVHHADLVWRSPGLQGF